MEEIGNIYNIIKPIQINAIIIYEGYVVFGIYVVNTMIYLYLQKQTRIHVNSLGELVYIKVY